MVAIDNRRYEAIEIDSSDSEAKVRDGRALRHRVMCSARRPPIAVSKSLIGHLSAKSASQTRIPQCTRVNQDGEATSAIRKSMLLSSAIKTTSKEIGASYRT